MKQFFKKANAWKIAAFILSFMLLTTMLPVLPVYALPTPIPVSVELNNFDTTNVGGDSSTTLLWARGNALPSSGVLRVAQNIGNQAGTVVRRNKIKLTGGFSTYFIMNLNTTTSGTPADGLVFVIQNNPSPIVGEYGGGLGYQGISNSYGVEFDIWKNTGGTSPARYDPDANHVAIVKDGNNSHAAGNGDAIDSNPGFNLYGSGDISVWIDYDGNTLTASYGTSADRATAKTISRNVGSALNNQDVYVGFAASTGGSNANHDIKKWYFKDSYVSSGLDPTPGTYTQGANGVSITLNPGSTNPTSANARVKDAVGNDMANETVSVYIDSSTTPDATLNTGADGTQANYNFSGLSQGAHTIKAVAASGGGATDTASFTITDNTPPSAPTITVTSPSGYSSGDWTNSNVSFTVGGSTDAESGINHYEYSTNGGSSWTTGSSDTISTADTYTLVARAVNGAGLTSNNSSSISANIDKTNPTGSLSIASTYGDTNYTRNQNVNLTISGSDTGGSVLQQMEISNNSDFSSSSGWISYNTSYSNWTLSNGNGSKTAYIRYKDGAGNISAPVSASIVFDNTPPTISISEPSRFSAKKGLTVSYILTINGADTLSGINAGDVSKIDLQGFGSVSSDIAAIKSGITIENTDATHRKVNIPLPSGLSNEGTIALKVLVSAASDNAGNQAMETLANFSFIVDSQPPTNQDSVFSTSQTVKGGQPVTLNMTSEAAGGFDSDSVRFAPAGYDGTNPANGTTITVTHGASDTINAPTTPGTYYIYIIDAAGNISQPSVATLTVKNDGPSVTVTGPTQANVQANSTVSYTVTFSGDTSNITLSQQDVALVTTGNANAYVSVSTVTGQPLQRQVSLSNLMGEGTVSIRIASGTATDAIGNLAAASAVSNPVTVDNTPAVVSPVTLVSNNSNTAKAKKGDTLTLNFTTNEPVQSTTVSIAGQTVNATNTSGDLMNWTAVYNVPTDSILDSLDGQNTPFSITTIDLAGNVSTPVTAVTSGVGVGLEFTAPNVTLTGTQDGSGTYTGPVTITFNKGTAVLSKDGTVIDSNLVSGSQITQQGSYTITVTDSAGNSTTKSFIYSQDYTSLMNDKDSLSIGYADGDSASSVTRNITLPINGNNGSDVTWQTSDSTYISVSGEVNRPTDSDKTVTLTANFVKGSYSDTKTFTLTVKKQPDTGSTAGKVQEDADSAYIIYADGDSAQNVTQAVYLSSQGIFWNSPITWASTDSSISISETVTNSVYRAEVTRPLFTDGDKTVILTATANYGASTAQKQFTLIVKRQPGTDSQKAQEDASTVYIAYASGDSASNVTQNIILYSSVSNGSNVVWSSSNPSYITNSGQVTRPSIGQGDKPVTMTATIRNGQETVVKTFTLLVLENTQNVQVSEDLAADRDNLQIGYRNGDTADRVTTHIILPASTSSGSQVTWATSDSGYIDINGTVTRAVYGSGDTPVTLTATLTKNGQTATKIFNLTVKQQPESLLDQIQEDFDSANIVYATGDSAQYVTRNVGLATTGANGSTITWVSSRPSVISSTGNVNRQNVDEDVLLTATITKGGFSRVKTFSVKVVSIGGITLSTDYDRLSVGYADGDSADSVTRTMYLPRVGATGTSVTWSSSRTDLVTPSGRVNRPGPDDTDRWVVLTAILTNPQTGQSMTKTFEVNVKKLSDEDAVKVAAKNLTSETAFNFGSGDTWESITQSFLMITTGDYNTSISWVSSKPDVISISSSVNAQNKLDASVTRQADDTQVILTATITRNGSSTTKTFLMIVKSADVNKTANETRQSTNRTADGSTSGGSQQFDILRTTLSNDEKVDTVIIDSAKMQSLTDNISPTDANTDNRTVTVTMQQSATDPSDEQAVEIPASAVSSVSDRNSQLKIATDTAGIRIEPSVMQTIGQSGTDLYFRLVPLKKSSDIQTMQTAVSSDTGLRQAATGNSVVVQGIPRMIETNYSGFDTYVTLPFTGMSIPAQNTQAFLSSLRVFVQHTDGTTEVKTGNIVYNGGTPYGVEIQINRFSNFQIVQFASNSGSGGTDTVTTKPVDSSESDISIQVDSKTNGEVTGDYEKAVVSGTDDAKTVSIQVIDAKVLDLLQKDPAKDTLAITITPENAHEISLTVSGETISALEKRSGGITLDNGSMSYAIDAGSIGSEYLKKQFPGTGLANIKVKIGLSVVGIDSMAGLLKAIKKAGASLVGSPVQLSVTSTDGNKTFSMSPFNGYSKLDIPIPQGQDANKITTAVRYIEDESLLHIPTTVSVKGGRYYARINNLEDGIFALIWHPLTFADMENHWAKEAVNDMGSRMVVSGVGNNMFEPDRDITRAEFAAIIVRALGLKPGTGTNSFTDVNASDWYSDYIKTAYEYTIISGYSSDKFGPTDKITREQAMTMIARAMKITRLKAELTNGEAEKLLAGFGDAVKSADYAKNSIAASVKAGIVSGRNGKMIAPKDNITRAEVAVTVRRLLQKSNLI